MHEGRVYAADARNARIQVFDSGYPHRIFGRDVLERPMNLSIRDGLLYVADYFTDAIEVFTWTGLTGEAFAPPTA